MGIQLPDLEYKVKADDHAFEVTAAKAKILGDGVERSIGSSSPAGQAFVTFGERGELAATRISSATAKTRADLDALETRTRSWAAETGKDFEAGTRAVLKLGDDGEIAVAKLSRAVNGLGTEVDKSSSSMLDFGRAGIQPMNALIGLAVVLGLVMTPLLAYTAGLAAAVALGATLLGGMTLLGAGVVALAAHFGGWTDAAENLTKAQTDLQGATTAHEQAVLALDRAQQTYNSRRTAVNLEALRLAQQKLTDSTTKLTAAQEAFDKATAAQHNPLQVLQDDLGKMADALGEQAVPAASMLLQWLDQLIPIVQQLGTELISWFQDRLPLAIPIATTVFQDFVTALEDLGHKVGPIFDELLAHPETFEKAMRDTFGGAVDAITWVITKLQDLSKWWADHGPELEATAKATVKALVDATLGLIGVLGDLSRKFNDVEKAAGAYGDTLLNKLAPATDDATTRQNHLVTVLDILGGILGGLGTILNAPIRAFGEMTQGVAELVGKVLNLTDKLGGAGSTASVVGGIFNWLANELAGLAEAGFRAAVPLFGIVDVLTGIWHAAEAAIGGIQRLISWINNIPGHKTVTVDVNAPSGFGPSATGGRAAGGPVIPGGIYDIGEHGPEKLVMYPGGGGYVIPNGSGSPSSGGSGSTYVTNITGVAADPATLARMAAREMAWMARTSRA